MKIAAWIVMIVPFIGYAAQAGAEQAPTARVGSAPVVLTEEQMDSVSAGAAGTAVNSSLAAASQSPKAYVHPLEISLFGGPVFRPIPPCAISDSYC